jgi:hypothetical protein
MDTYYLENGPKKGQKQYVLPGVNRVLTYVQNELDGVIATCSGNSTIVTERKIKTHGLKYIFPTRKWGPQLMTEIGNKANDHLQPYVSALGVFGENGRRSNLIRLMVENLRYHMYRNPDDPFLRSIYFGDRLGDAISAMVAGTYACLINPIPYEEMGKEKKFIENYRDMGKLLKISSWNDPALIPFLDKIASSRNQKNVVLDGCESTRPTIDMTQIFEKERKRFAKIKWD